VSSLIFAPRDSLWRKAGQAARLPALAASKARLS